MNLGTCPESFPVSICDKEYEGLRCNAKSGHIIAAISLSHLAGALLDTPCLAARNGLAVRATIQRVVRL